MTLMCSKLFVVSILFCATARTMDSTAGKVENLEKTARFEKSSRTEPDAPRGGLRDDDDDDDEIPAIPAGVQLENSALLQAVFAQLRADPLVLTCALLLVAYLVAQLAVRPKPAALKAEKKKGYGKSTFCVSVNQKLVHMGTWEEILDCALHYQNRTDVVNVVTAVHRSTKLALTAGATKKLVRDPRLSRLLEQLQGFLQQDMGVAVRTRAVGNTSWALAKLNYRPVDSEKPLLALLAANFGQYAAHFKPEELMNTVWAFAELSRDAKENEELALQVAKAAVTCGSKFADFSLQQVVYFAWALARLSTVSPVRTDAEVVFGLLEFKMKIVDRCTPEVSSLTTKNLAMVSWATAHLHKVRPDAAVLVTPLLQAVAQHAVSRGLRSFVAGELASIMWALSKCQVEAQGFYDALKAHLAQHGLAGFSSQDLANVVCAFVNADAGDDELYRLLADGCSRNKSFNKLEKTMVSWAFSQIDSVAAPKLP